MLNRMVKRANDLVYNALREDGVTPVMGAELEFTVSVTNDAKNQKRVDANNPLNMKDNNELIDIYLDEIPQIAKKIEQESDISEHEARNRANAQAGKNYDEDLHRPAADSQKPEKAQGFENSPYVANTYKEGGQLQYEVVIPHEPTQFGDQTLDAEGENSKKGRPAHKTLPRAIEGVKKAVTDNVAKSRDLAAVDFSATGDYHITNGMHINVSLENEKGENLVHDLIREKKDQKFVRFMQEALLEVAGTTVKDGKGLERVEHMATSDLLKMKGSNRFENRLPSASTDAGVAVLTTLVAVKHAYDKEVKADKFTAVEVRDQELWKTTPEKLAENLEKGHVMRDMLNELSDGEKLGDRIEKAFLQQIAEVKMEKPPSQGWGAQGWGR